MTVYKGQCHCGAIGFRFATEAAPSQWAIRACQCSFCRAHGALCTSDPRGEVRFILDESKVQRYRFALQTADFLLCRECGVYIGAVLTDMETGVAFATLNTRAMDLSGLDVPSPQPVEYGQESASERRRRRKERWTPVVGTV